MANEEEEKAFLEECQASGDRAYDALKAVLQRLQNSETTKEARVFLHRLEKRVNAELPSGDSLAKYHFRIHDLFLGDSEGSHEGFHEAGQKLKLLELPSIFIPEEWSFTFLEGLNRHPESGFEDRDVVELGCGNGWISIALAQRTSPKRIYGLDINPRAIKVAKINLYLNALREDGSLITDHEGKSLLDRVEFHVSDLLAYCRERNIMLDRIVGCIPQILNPNPEAMASIVSENAAEEFLYALSNYCGLQGFVEDQFGLGLVARAAEEGITLLRPNGAMIFNMGGRPGQAVCERLFERRGFHIKKLWQTRVVQAADTDILALVEIEKNSRHRFEFFMGLVCEEPINARTAYTYSKAGGEIAHGLSVYECRLRLPKQVKTIFKFLSDDGWEETRGALDLSFEEEAKADEKIPFLAHLARTLKGLSFFPLDLEIGGSVFRSLISSFIRNYHRVPLTLESVAVLPSRTIAIELILQLFSPKLALVDTKLTKLLPRKWIASIPSQGKSGDESEGNITVIEAPQRTDLVTQLLKRLKPEVVVTSVAAFELQTSTAFEQLLNVTGEVGARLFLDMSDHFDLSSLPGSNGVLQYMASHPLPLHVGIICGLVKNQVYSDLEVAFVLSENWGLVKALDKIGEVNYGRTAVASQFYYGCLLHELLRFQLLDRHNTPARSPRNEDEQSKFIKFSDHTMKALSGIETPSNISVDRSDLGVVDLQREENCLEIPPVVKVSIFEGFARQNIAAVEMDPTPEIHSFVKRKYGFGAEELILSSSSTALFSKLVQACVEEHGTLCFPTGSNGNKVSLAKFLQATTLDLPTSEDSDFKLTGDLVDEFMKTVQNPWVYISGPTISPTGLTYSRSDIASILESCERYGVRVIIDTSSSGLEYDSYEAWELDRAPIGIHKPGGKFAVALLGVLSLELLIGGIECAYAAISDPFFVDALRDSSNLSKPHGTLKYSVKKLLHMHDEKSDDLLLSSISQKAELKSRAQKLQQVLIECGWKVITPLGGISLIASPHDYEGKHVSCRESDGVIKEVLLNSSNVRDALFRTTGLYVSSCSWTGISGYYRFVISSKKEDFLRAMDCIQSFKKLAFQRESARK